MSARKNTDSDDSISSSLAKKDRSSSESLLEISSSYKTLREELSHYIQREESENSEISRSHYPGIERTNYDFAIERHNLYATNILEATSYLIKRCLRIGILTIHEAFMFGGILASTLGSIAVAVLISSSMFILVLSAQKMYSRIRVSYLSYADLCEAAVAISPCKKLRKYSQTFRYALECFSFLQMTGTCSIYQIVIARTVKLVVEYLFSPNSVQLSIKIYIIIVTLPLLLVCLIRRWKYLAPISFVVDLFLAICIITTIFYSMSEPTNLLSRPLFKSFPGLFKFLSICLYSMDGITQVLTIENNMKSPQHIRFVIVCGMMVMCIVVTATGFLGYWGWGEACRSPITSHMPKEPIPMLLQSLVALILIATFAIQFWVPFKLAWHYLMEANEDGYSNLYGWEWLCRVLYLFIITSISTMYPQPEKMMIFLGSFFVSLNTFVFPSLLNWLVTWGKHRRRPTSKSIIKDVLLCILGVIFCVGGLHSLSY